ncbi:hypothetical protein COLO4_01195 [Corchorus olitorius]|uniref:Uncharacterized protein n=1 Tax=Corchorus olitorius TaxID=93759 RepID=A0A1R3KZD5_9ROSI|nr:hypothetical protein COLO4_04074 [Corchorus olitorius]OMP12378.1 hypothetical protein COLO4_03271 [Corchorus olitorius]OMP13663.1 hypothetical protein COLO4_01195 [Corchorus olitorius]
MLRIKKQLSNRESPPSESALSSLAHGGASRSVRGHALERYEATRSTAIGACSGVYSLVYGSGSRSRYVRYAAGSAPALASGGSTFFAIFIV